MGSSVNCEGNLGLTNAVTADQRALIYSFGGFEIDSTQRTLLRSGRPVALAPKSFDTLLYLVKNRGRVVRKEDLLKALWPDSHAEERNLNQYIYILRRILGSHQDGSYFIETIPRIGYRFIASAGKQIEALNREQKAKWLFLCHSSEDKPAVKELYQRLKSDGFDPWLDAENLIPGQDWHLEIRSAVRNSYAVAVCLSVHSITKRGFVQKEIKYALNVANEQPEGAIFLIPVRLEECDVPEHLRKWQWVDYFKDGGYKKLTTALNMLGQ